LPAAVKEIERTWNSIYGDIPFKYSFLDDDFNALYQSEQSMRSVLSLFTFLSVLVACLGLFGLAAFTVRQRFKEIGIRKVLGASVGNVVTLLSKDFLKLVLLAIIIAAPLAWLGINRWLQDFAYRISISAWVFILAGIVAALIALITVSLQAIKA